ncbi:hypothetical protein Q7P37_006167 [Cladosporium fusiforme]
MGLTSLVPLIILFAVVGGAAYFGYQIYLWSNELADRGQKHMEKKNMSFTKEGGLKVGVKQMGAEEYADRTQRVLVNTWNEANPGLAPRPASARTNSGSRSKY